MLLPLVKTVKTPASKQIIQFLGFNDAPVISDGEMRDMKNLTSDRYPNLYQRAPRGMTSFAIDVSDPDTLFSRKDKLAVIAGDQLRYGYYTNAEGQQIAYTVKNLGLTDAEKSICAVNTRLVIWERQGGSQYKAVKKWINVDTVQQILDKKTLQEDWIRQADNTTDAAAKTQYMENADDIAAEVDALETGDDYCGDIEKFLTAGSMAEYGSVKVTLSTNAVMLHSDSVIPDDIIASAKGFTKGDAISIVGTTGSRNDTTAVIQAVDVSTDNKDITITFPDSSFQMYDVKGNLITNTGALTTSAVNLKVKTAAAAGAKEIFVKEKISTDDANKLIDRSVKILSNEYAIASAKAGDAGSASITLETGTVETVPVATVIYPSDPTNEMDTTTAPVKMSREAPELDYLMEQNNRLWGCKNNSIYSSKLGDPTNWFYYQSTSADSYAVDVASDGIFTGCVALASHLVFFKEEHIHKLYGSKPANYQVVSADAHGLESGSERSIAVINDVAIYKSKMGIMAYSGSTPQLLSTVWGARNYNNVVGGSDTVKYWCSAHNISTGDYEVFVFDMAKKLWHKEDSTKIADFASVKGKLYYIDATDANNTHVLVMNPDDNIIEEKIDWMAELGDFDEYSENKKIYSKLQMRLNMDAGSTLTILVRFDSGSWEQIRHIYAEEKRAIYIPIIPRRCDKFRIRLEGTGYSIIESLVREYREGSEM